MGKAVNVINHDVTHLGKLETTFRRREVNNSSATEKGEIWVNLLAVGANCVRN